MNDWETGIVESVAIQLWVELGDGEDYGDPEIKKKYRILAETAIETIRPYYRERLASLWD